MESCSVKKILRRKKLNSDGNCDGHFDGKVRHNFEGKLPEMRFFWFVMESVTNFDGLRSQCFVKGIRLTGIVTEFSVNISISNERL